MLRYLAVIAVLVLACNAASWRDAERNRRVLEAMRDCPTVENDNSAPRTTECKSKPMEISFVVDASASIRQENFTIGLYFIEDFVRLFDISPSAIRVSLVTYGEVAYGEDAFGFSAYPDKDSLVEAIAGIPYRSGSKTNTSGGINFMIDNHLPEARAGVRHVVIVLTDGNSQQPDLTAQAAARAKQLNLEVFAIGAGQSVSPVELHSIASDNRHVFVVSSYKMLEDIKKRLAYEVCDVENDNSAPRTTECKSKPMEISFVVDASASIWQENFTIGLNFIEDFVRLFDVSPSAIRVSLVTYGEVAYGEDAFGFSAYPDKDSLVKAIAGIPYRSGNKTNTSGGINFMIDNHLPEARAGVRHVVIVLTDGNSQQPDLTAQAAARAQQLNLEVFAIGAGQSVSPEELHMIASDNRHVFVVSSYKMLEDIKKRLAYEVCDVPAEPPCQMDPVDLSFVIDSSGSISASDFTVGMDFVQDFVKAFQINPSAVRVSVVTFGDVVYDEDAFDFDKFSNSEDLLDALQAITWRHGYATNTGAAIAYMRDSQMPKARPTAAHICIVITDGQSQQWMKTKEEAEAAQTQGIVMYAVGVGRIGQELNEVELNDIAGDSTRVLTVDNYAKLNTIREQLTAITCTGIIAVLHQMAEDYRV